MYLGKSKENLIKNVLDNIWNDAEAHLVINITSDVYSMVKEPTDKIWSLVFTSIWSQIEDIQKKNIEKLAY